MPPQRGCSPLHDVSSQQSSNDNIAPMFAPKIKSTRDKSRKSWIWKYGTEIPGKNGTRWRCDICPRPIAKTFSDSSTSHAAEHLRDAHSTSETGELPTNQTTIRQKPPVNIIILRKLIVEWVVDRRHSFNEIEAESFRRIIAYINPPTINQVPRSANTISSDIIQYFKEARSMIVELLSTARSKIHLSFDLWT